MLDIRVFITADQLVAGCLTSPTESYWYQQKPGWPRDLEPMPLWKQEEMTVTLSLKGQSMMEGFSQTDRHPVFCSESFCMIVFEVLGALCWDRHPFHAPGVCSDLREIRWNMKSTTGENTRIHTHAIPQRPVIACLLGSFLDCRQISQEQRLHWRLQRPHLHLLFFPFLCDWHEWSGDEGFTTPNPHISCPLQCCERSGGDWCAPVGVEV